MYSTWAENVKLCIFTRPCRTKQSWMGGLFQPLADGLKLFAKEEFEPNTPNRFFVFCRAWIIKWNCFNDKCCYSLGRPFCIFGKEILLQATDINIGLYTFWSSFNWGIWNYDLDGLNNKFSLMGAVRAASQMVSYEVAMDYQWLLYWWWQELWV